MTQQPPPYGGPGYGYPPQPPKHPQAVTALVLGIVVCGLCGPFAWSMGARVEREIAAAGGAYGGGTEAIVGKVLGIVATVLLAISVLVFGLFVLGGGLAALFSVSGS